LETADFNRFKTGLYVDSGTMKLSRKLQWLFFSGLTVYTLAVAAVEFFVSQRAARYFLTDMISNSPEFGHLPFFAVNTSLSVFFLWAGAVLFLMAWRSLTPEEYGGKEELFLVSQLLIFFSLGADDRFLIHEGLSDTLEFKDWIFFGILGALEAYCLLVPGRLFQRGFKALCDIFIAGSFFGLMMLADVILPHNMVLRLSIEDLAKLWSAVFLFKFAWDTCTEKIDSLKGSQIENP
jgi:hypothetical protein